MAEIDKQRPRTKFTPVPESPAIYPSTKKTTGLPVDELVFWYGMFAPKGRYLGTTGLPVGLHFN